MRMALLLLVMASTFGCSSGRKYVAGEFDSDANRRLVNLKKAATLPWADDGRCAVQKASNEWGAVVERCYDRLDWSRIKFKDHDHRCRISSADTASAVRMVGICLLTQPELAEVIVIVGTVVIAAAIAAELHEQVRCKKVAEGCRETCAETSLPSGDHGFRFWNCVNMCLEKAGCTSGMY